VVSYPADPMISKYCLVKMLKDFGLRGTLTSYVIVEVTVLKTLRN